MKTIRQYLNYKNIWVEINDLIPFPFITPETNTLFIIEYGSLPVYSGVCDLTAKELAKVLVNLYSEKWLTLLDLSDEVFNNLSATRKIKTTENIETAENRQETRADIDKVSAYNDVNLITDSGKDSESSGETTGERERLTETIESDLTKAFERLPMLEKLNIIDVAMKDVANFLKIAIY